MQLFFDGACEPVNPGGIGAYGFVVYEGNREVYGEGGVVCVGGALCTNNVAEYTALIKAMEWALAAGAREVEVYGDSQLVVRQMLGVYQVRAPHLKPLFEKAVELSRRFENLPLRGSHVRETPVPITTPKRPTATSSRHNQRRGRDMPSG
jgi:Ribonuclease HI